MKKIIFLFVFALILNLCPAQVNDFQLWTEMEVQAYITEKLSISYENENRFYENVSLLGRNQNDIGITYDINDLFALGASYRLNYYYVFTDYTYSKTRWVVDSYYTPRYKRWRFQLRLRVSNDNEHIAPKWLEHRPIHRERFRIRYNFRRSPFRVHFATETYFPISTNNPFELSKLRSFAGVQYVVSDSHRFGFDFLIDKEYNTNNPLTAYVLQFSYRYDIGGLVD